MRRLFISYRSLDSQQVDAIVASLRQLKESSGENRYYLWQDKGCIPAGHDWWQAILDGIINCQYFIFMVSHESVKSTVCRGELHYARKRNRPIIPIVLKDEYYLNPSTGKNDIAYWSDMPNELEDIRAQFLFYQEETFIEQLESAITAFEREAQHWRDIPADKPADPRYASDGQHNAAAIYDAAYDFALRLEIDHAERLFQQLVNTNDPDFGEDALIWIGILREYQKMVYFDARETTRYRIGTLWTQYSQKFPLPFITLFDPKDFQSRYQDQPTAATANAASDIELTSGYHEAAEEWFMKGHLAAVPDDKIQAYTQAIHLKPDYADAYYQRALVYYYDLEKITQAIEDYTQAIQHNPHHADAYEHRGWAYYFDKRDNNRALADYQQLIRLKPDNAEGFYGLGNVYYRQHDYDHAIRAYEKALQLKPGFEFAREFLELAKKKKANH